MIWQYLILTNTHGELRADPPTPLTGGTISAVLNELGEDGWELVGTESGQMVFKRKKKRPVFGWGAR